MSDSDRPCAAVCNEVGRRQNPIFLCQSHKPITDRRPNRSTSGLIVLTHKLNWLPRQHFQSKQGEGNRLFALIPSPDVIEHNRNSVGDTLGLLYIADTQHRLRYDHIT